MIPRHLAHKVTEAAKSYPVVTVTGPRQSGKTTLVKALFPEHRYFNLELPDIRALFHEDPRGMLREGDGLVIDEAQRLPDIFSYIQGAVDDDPRPGRFILTGSQNFLLLQSVSQSLAGRVSVQHLLPLSLSELMGRSGQDPGRIGVADPESSRPDFELGHALVTGFFPRIHDQKLDASDWLGNYVQTYLERDVRSVVNVGDLDTFSRFLSLCAGRSGQLLNLSALALDAGVSHSTARRWLSILQASFQVVLVGPYHRSFTKRLVKSPKLHFLDPGLLCHLLRISSPEQLLLDRARGAVFESFVVGEVYKRLVHAGEAPWLYFWRDRTGREIDLVFERGQRIVAIEAKAGETVTPEFFRHLDVFRELAGDLPVTSAVVFGGSETGQRKGVNLIPWWRL